MIKMMTNSKYQRIQIKIRDLKMFQPQILTEMRVIVTNTQPLDKRKKKKTQLNTQLNSSFSMHKSVAFAAVTTLARKVNPQKTTNYNNDDDDDDEGRSCILGLRQSHLSCLHGWLLSSLVLHILVHLISISLYTFLS